MQKDMERNKHSWERPEHLPRLIEDLARELHGLVELRRHGNHLVQRKGARELLEGVLLIREGQREACLVLIVDHFRRIAPLREHR